MVIRRRLALLIFFLFPLMYAADTKKKRVLLPQERHKISPQERLAKNSALIEYISEKQDYLRGLYLKISLEGTSDPTEKFDLFQHYNTISFGQKLIDKTDMSLWTNENLKRMIRVVSSDPLYEKKYDALYNKERDSLAALILPLFIVKQEIVAYQKKKNCLEKKKAILELLVNGIPGNMAVKKRLKEWFALQESLDSCLDESDRKRFALEAESIEKEREIQNILKRPREKQKKLTSAKMPPMTRLLIPRIQCQEGSDHATQVVCENKVIHSPNPTPNPSPRGGKSYLLLPERNLNIKKVNETIKRLKSSPNRQRPSSAPTRRRAKLCDKLVPTLERQKPGTPRRERPSKN